MEGNVPTDHKATWGTSRSHKAVYFRSLTQACVVKRVLYKYIVSLNSLCFAIKALWMEKTLTVFQSLKVNLHLKLMQLNPHQHIAQNSTRSECKENLNKPK